LEERDMLAFLLRRLGQSALVMAVMATLVFVGVYAIGNPIDILVSPDADQIERAAVVARLGLDQPLWVQFGVFVKHALVGDLGMSFVQGVPAFGLILSRMPATLELAFVALVFSIVAGIPLGMIAGLMPRSPVGRGIMTGSILGFSLPNFWLGLMLILLFAVELKVLPAGGRGATREVFGVNLSLFTLDGWRHLILPAATLAIYKASLVARLTYASTREALLQDFVRFARAKGLSQTRIVCVHVLKVILIPVITVIGLELGSMIAFAVVTETVFAWPGMGKLLIDSIYRLDRPVIVAYLMVVVAMFVIINLAVDILYSLLDPRIRLSEQKT
jgi:peptide/nickel transport system permease protein